MEKTTININVEKEIKDMAEKKAAEKFMNLTTYIKQLIVEDNKE